jgi:hypothetical protein
LKDETNWTEKYDIEKITMTGFIAQEVEQAAKSLNYEFSGVVAPENKNELYSLRYSEFVVPVVKGLQEIDIKVEDVFSTVEKLKAENEKLKSENESMQKDLAEIKSQLGIQNKEQVPVSKIGGKKVTIQPNPANANFMVTFNNENNSSANLIIIDSTGKEIAKQQTFKNEAYVDCQKFANGTYKLMIIINNKITGAENFVVVK